LTVRKENRTKSMSDADALSEQLPESLRRAVDLTKKKGSSSWLTALLLSNHDFTLHKGAFLDALALRYG